MKKPRKRSDAQEIARLNALIKIEERKIERLKAEVAAQDKRSVYQFCADALAEGWKR